MYGQSYHNIACDVTTVLLLVWQQVHMYVFVRKGNFFTVESGLYVNSLNNSISTLSTFFVPFLGSWTFRLSPEAASLC